MTQRDHILSVAIENFKIIREARIDDMGDVVEIKGDTGQGKTSIIEAIKGAITGIDPSLVRFGTDEASITIETSKIKLLRKQTSYGTGKGSLKITDKATGKDVAKGMEFLAALFPTGSVFDPLEFVKLGGGEAKGKTERLRRQRDMLIEAIPNKIDDEFLRGALNSYDIEAVKVLENGGADLRFIDYDRHSLDVCVDVGDRIYTARKAVNQAKEDAERTAEKAQVPATRPKETVAELTAKITALDTEKRAAEIKQGIRTTSVERRDKLKADIEAKRAPLTSLDEAKEKKVIATDTIATIDKEILKAEGEIRKLQERLTSLNTDRRKEADIVSQCNADIESHGAVTTLEASLADIEKDIAEDNAAQVAKLTDELSAAQASLADRKLDEAHRAAHDAAEAARKKATMFDGAVELFRDTLPKKIIESMKMPVEGLAIEEGVVSLRGIPLHQLGTSEQMKVGVMLATAFNPNTGFICVDGAESMGRKERLELRDAAKEAGVQLILTTVDPDAKPAPGVVIMENGATKK